MNQKSRLKAVLRTPATCQSLPKWPEYLYMKNILTAEIIAIGSELLTPNRSATNSLWITELLNSVGIDVKLKTIVGDDEARLEETIRDAMKRSNIIISTGGLGPTEDDITRKIFSRVLNRPLILNEKVLAGIK